MYSHVLKLISKVCHSKVYTSHSFLSIVVEPDKPEALLINAIGSQFASIQWNAPAYIGYPALTEYEIELTSDSMTRTMVTDMTMLLVEGLDPGTVYIVTVKAISEIFPDGGDTITTTFETDQSS